MIGHYSDTLTPIRYARGASNVTVSGHYQDASVEVLRKVKAANITTLGKAAAYIRGIARRSISKKDTVSKPGNPPHSPTGRLHASIAFNVDRKLGVAVIGPARAIIAEIGRTHEFGGTEGRKNRAKRHQRKFDLRIGGVGPIRLGRRTRSSNVLTESQMRSRIRRTYQSATFARLLTSDQVARSKEIAAQMGLPPSVTGLTPESPQRRYPPRPFMRPALNRSRARLPAFWRNSVKGD